MFLSSEKLLHIANKTPTVNEYETARSIKNQSFTPRHGAMTQATNLFKNFKEETVTPKIKQNQQRQVKQASWGGPQGAHYQIFST